MKIAIVGAGAFIFPQMLCRDILSFPALQDCEIALFDIDLGRAAVTQAGVRKLVDDHRLPAQVTATDVRRDALTGADFVLCTFQVGGLEAFKLDIEIPAAFGIDQAVGDTLGPGGIFRGLRSIAALREIAHDMLDLCPEALLIQYANPMSINCWATTEMGVRTVGLCHSVQGTSKMLAGELGVPYEQVTYDCAGVNHTAWFTTFRRGDEDLLPAIRQAMRQRHLEEDVAGAASDHLYGGGSERVRTELMELTGYFHTESSHHASEYWSWFRRTPEMVSRYIPKRWSFYDLSVEMAAMDRSQMISEEVAKKGLVPSEEYGAYIIDSCVTGTPRVIYGNVPNSGGAIENLAPDASVEVACLVDRNGLRPVRYGTLPPACAALNTVQVNVQRLAVRAGMDGDRTALYAAVALDPLSSALLELPDARRMVDAMLEAEARWLPQFS